MARCRARRPGDVRTLTEPVLVGDLACVAVQRCVGVVVSRRIVTEDDYLVAGRRLGPFRTSLGIALAGYAAGAIAERGPRSAR